MYQSQKCLLVEMSKIFLNGSVKVQNNELVRTYIIDSSHLFPLKINKGRGKGNPYRSTHELNDQNIKVYFYFSCFPLLFLCTIKVKKRRRNHPSSFSCMLNLNVFC